MAGFYQHKMLDEVSDQITVLLAAWNNGDTSARDRLMPLVYDELRRIARQFMRRQPAGRIAP